MSLTLRELDASADLARQLARQGLSAPAARDKAALFAQVADALRDAGTPASAPVRAFYVPGRIEVLGKHTDYAGGRSLLAVPERGFCVVAHPRTDAQLRVLNVAGADEAAFTLSPDLTPASSGWTNYPMTVARRLARNFAGPLRGAELAFLSDLPMAAGMSSSSALMVSVFLALSAINDLPARGPYRQAIDTREALAEYLGTVENGQSFGPLPGDRGVGTFGGSEDHTAMLCCEAGRLRQYRFCPVALERSVALAEPWAFVIASSGVLAEKTGSARELYNRASRLAGEAARLWRLASGGEQPHLAAAIDAAGPGAVRDAVASGAGQSDFAAEDLLRRVDHFVAESERVIPAAVDALAGGDMDGFGLLVDRSQDGAERLLGNQVLETVFLARTARELGAEAASAFGAGFGGSVWALAPREQADTLAQLWAVRYSEAFPAPAARAAFLVTRPGPAAFEVARS